MTPIRQSHRTRPKDPSYCYFPTTPNYPTRVRPPAVKNHTLTNRAPTPQW